ncbi:serine aminopeptidase domain-containing protein [Brevundimonas sp.]|uniref:serine aminopeptidase domain-containing protein n=1 Tax=Brevundimonas sp. TaxID=1871086 RepID=UPI003BAD365B
MAVILPGSGPTDRDGNSALGVAASTYRLLAEGLADQGVATLRIDKRGVAASAAAGPAEADLRFDAYAADARAWAAEAASRAGKPCAWLIGHSEGALVALKAVQGGDDKICGLILLSGAGRPAGAVLREQLASLPEPTKTQAFAALTELEAGRTVADAPPALAALLRPSVQPYLISWLPLDPAALIAAYDGPVFIGQGTTDLQVSVTDAPGPGRRRPQGDPETLGRRQPRPENRPRRPRRQHGHLRRPRPAARAGRGGGRGGVHPGEWEALSSVAVVSGSPGRLSTPVI